MKKHYFLILLPVLMTGCFNDRGVSMRYYNDCEEYYDAQGYYHKQCDKNLIDYKDIKEVLQPVQNPEKGSVR
ncbi:MAG TPA: hypothetical protein VEZ39_08285 [Sulfuricurvum sp.]|nr:hypothetical protein [Sulfuricurvum sp.]